MRKNDYIGKPVTSLQTMLRWISAADPAIPAVTPNGIYGSETKRAVTVFQRKNGLPASGVTDYDTWKAICRAYHTAKTELDPAQPLEVVMQPHKPLLPGSDNRNLLLVQCMLHNLHEVYEDIPDCELSGKCDASTERAIRALQELCGMQCTGVVDKALWQLLCGLYTQAIGDGER